MMKRTKFFLVALLCLLIQSVPVLADDVVIEPSQLPEAAQTFIKQQFPDKKIKLVEKDLGEKPDYEVKLAGGIELEFDEKGEWKKVDCGRRAVPAELVPAKIADYVKANRPKAKVTGVTKKCYGYEIDLSKGPDLLFDKNCEFFSIDR